MHGLAILLWADIALTGPSHAGAPYVMPYDVDPPITIDGSLADWEDVPNPIVLQSKEQVTYMPQTWTGPGDLSGTVRLAWREGIYIAATVTDDLVQQPFPGPGLYKGDHVNLWIDFRPGLEPKRVLFGEGQYHIAISPGNFGGDAGAPPVKPEVLVYLPEGLPSDGGRVAARRTEDGYQIEAFIPFSRLRLAPPRRDQYATFEVALGDSDASPARQETFMTYGTKQWKYLRSRMLPLIFGSGDGTAAVPSRSIPIGAELNIPKKTSKTITFTVGPLDPTTSPSCS